MPLCYFVTRALFVFPVTAMRIQPLQQKRKEIKPTCSFPSQSPMQLINILLQSGVENINPDRLDLIILQSIEKHTA